MENVENIRDSTTADSKKKANEDQDTNNMTKVHKFGRSYFDGEAYTGIGYQDFIAHYNTVSFIKNRNPKSVIDIGGARGYIVKRLNDQGIPSTCMDISEHCYHTRATDSFILHDLCNAPWPIKDKEFDLAVSVSSLEHVPEENISSVIKEISRISNKGLHGITFEITPQDIDRTHLSGTIKPKEWWISKFKEIAPDYPVEIVDKEEMEAGPVVIPSSPDNLVKLNIGSFINMYHYGWINIDKINLSEFAEQNGYIFRQEDISNHIPYGNNSVDIIIASHFLEHLDREGGKKFLSECSRVLKPKGIIRITVPDTELITKKYIDKSISECGHFNAGVEKSDDDTQSLYELLLAGHKTVYDFDSLSKFLSKTGFDNVKKMEFNKSKLKEIETQTIDMYPTLSLYAEATPALEYNDISETIGQQDISKDKIKSTKNVASKNWEILTAGKSSTDQVPNTQTYSSDKKLRIALVSTPFFGVPPQKYGGLEQVVWDLAEALDELGHKVTIFAPEGSQKTKNGFLIETGKSINTVNVDWFGLEKSAYDIYKEIITPDRYDIIHDHTWFAFPYLLKQKYQNLNVIHTNHGGYSWDTAPPFPKPNLVSISNFMKQYTEQYFRQKGFNIQSQYVYNGINLDMYRYNPSIMAVPEIAPVPNNHLLFVGRLSTFKQPHLAIELARKTNHKLDIVGGTFVDSQDYVKQLDKMVENDPNIKIYKDVDHDFKVRRMQEAKALIFPSKMGEPFGLVASEAMACGTPVIAFNDGAISEVVIHGKTGYICQDINEMIDAVNNIHKIKSEDCRKRAEDLSRQVMAKNYEKLYYRIMNKDEW